MDRIPNFDNIDAIYLRSGWDPGNKYSVLKDWGTTGWIYDNTVITDALDTWEDFIAAAHGSGERQGVGPRHARRPHRHLLLGERHRLDHQDPADLDACEAFIVDEFASHIKAFDSYPGINLTSGNYVLSQVWNGDARQGLLVGR